MTAQTELAPFDDEVRHAVAEASGVEIEALDNAVTDHQATMREVPGVEDLVYEWRKQYDDPVLVRTPELFIVAVPPTVWEEYGDYLGLDEALLGALSAVHQEQAIRTDAVDPADIPEGHAVVVVARQ